jgi:hypothetical protein
MSWPIIEVLVSGEEKGGRELREAKVGKMECQYSREYA